MATELSIGIARIDAQHQDLVDRVTELLSLASGDCNVDQVLPRFEELQARVVEHFGTEEQLMAEHCFPGEASHRARHEAFVKGFLELKAEVASGAAVPELRARIEREVAAWLMSHIRAHDVPMAQFLIERGV